MNQPLHVIHYPELSLRGITHAFWLARRFWLVGACVGLVFAGLLMLVAVPQMRADLMLAPAQSLDRARASVGLAGSADVQALAMMAQRFGGGTGVNASAFVRFEHIYSGAHVAGQLLEDPRIVEGLKADRRLRFGAEAAGDVMEAEQLADYIARRVRFVPVKSSPLRALRYQHADAAFARYFLSRLHAVADDFIRTQTLAEAGARRDYLQQALGRALNPEHRRSLSALLMEQERILMLANAPHPYAASIVEPVSVFYKAVWPNAKLIFPLFMMLGGLIGCGVYGLRGLSDE